MHLVLALVLVLNHFNNVCLGVSKYTINTLATIFYVVVLVQLSVDFVFENQEKSDLSQDENATIAAIQTEQDVELTKDEIKLQFWLYIEMLMFFTNIASNVIFMLYRSCSNSRIYSY